jgi:site-specific DNA-adenine methylase
MFSYYGGKSKIAKYYPDPAYDLVIEPFSGAGWYSFVKNAKKVWLNDIDENIYDVWTFLIEKATYEGLEGLKNWNAGDDLRKVEMPQGHRKLLGFLASRGSSSPANIVQKWACQSKKNPQFASTMYSSIDRIQKNLSEIKKIKFTKSHYLDLPNHECTWFVDPPYEHGGSRYKNSQIDYSELKQWIESRKGQVIVCENTSASWIDGDLLTVTHGQKKKTNEIFFVSGMCSSPLSDVELLKVKGNGEN